MRGKVKAREAVLDRAAGARGPRGAGSRPPVAVGASVDRVRVVRRRSPGSCPCVIAEPAGAPVDLANGVAPIGVVPCRGPRSGRGARRPGHRTGLVGSRAFPESGRGRPGVRRTGPIRQHERDRTLVGRALVLLAELIVRHTRRHMPTRRVALESAYLPTSGPAHGVALLAAVMATNLAAVDDDERDLSRRLVDDACGGLSIPRIALRHRLQRDVHGLDRLRHRLLGEDGRLVLELDAHGAADPAGVGSGARRPRGSRRRVAAWRSTHCAAS